MSPPSWGEIRIRKDYSFFYFGGIAVLYSYLACFPVLLRVISRTRYITRRHIVTRYRTVLDR